MKKQLIFTICLLTGVSLSAMNNVISSKKIKKNKQQQTSSTTELMSGGNESETNIELYSWHSKSLRRAPSMRRKLTDTLLERSRVILGQRGLYQPDIEKCLGAVFNENEKQKELWKKLIEIFQFEIDGLADEIQRTVMESKQEIIELRKEHNISRRKLTIVLAIFGSLFTIANLTINALNATDTIQKVTMNGFQAFEQCDIRVGKISEVLTLGVLDENNHTVLIEPNKKVPLGGKLY